MNYHQKDAFIVARIAQRVEVYRREQAQLVRVATLLAGDRLDSPLLSGFAAEIAPWFG